MPPVAEVQESYGDPGYDSEGSGEDLAMYPEKNLFPSHLIYDPERPPPFDIRWVDMAESEENALIRERAGK